MLKVDIHIYETQVRMVQVAQLRGLLATDVSTTIDKKGWVEKTLFFVKSRPLSLNGTGAGCHGKIEHYRHAANSP